MSKNYLEAKAVLNEVKSSTWRFFKFRVVGGDVDKSFVHCKLCLDQGNKKRGQIKVLCWHNKSAATYEDWLKTVFPGNAYVLLISVTLDFFCKFKVSRN